MVAKFRRIKKRKKKSSFSTIAFTVVIFSLIIFLAFSSLRISKRKTELYSKILILEERLHELEQRKENLEASISYQKSKEYVEEVARDKLNLKGIGEQSVTFIMDEERERDEETNENFFSNFLNRIKFW